MGTKLRNISVSIWTKLAILAVGVFIVGNMAHGLAIFMFENQDKDISLMAESMFCEKYQDTEHYANFLYGSLGDVSRISQGKTLSGVKADYYIEKENGDKIYSRTQNEADYTGNGYSEFIVFKDGKAAQSKGNIGQMASYWQESEKLKDKTVIVSVSEEYMAKKTEEFLSLKASGERFATANIQMLGLLVLTIILQCAAAGKKPNSKGNEMIFWDRGFTELHIAAIGICLFGYIVGSARLLSELLRLGVYTSSKNAIIAVFTALSIAAYLVVLFIFLSVVRKIKCGKLIKTSFVYWCFSKVKMLFKSIYVFSKEFIDAFMGIKFKDTPFSSAFHKLQIRYIICSVVFVALFLFFFFAFMPVAIVIMILELLVTYIYVKRSNSLAVSMTRLLTQIKEVSSGNLMYNSQIEPEDFLYGYSKMLFNIGEGLNEALEKQMKDERMKIELVTNVSHDLKTPLTSIISYIDLLKKEPLDETSMDYVNILAKKADRLKGIVSDLFDLAKSTSGNIELDLEVLDFRKLIQQLLTELDDKIQASLLTVKTDICDEAMPIRADGKKMSRALQNLIDNALKYSLSGSRVFIELCKKNETAVFTIKNTSAYEMDFTGEEISQRFVRGDKTRSGDGSGLGISIAQSFTEVCGGKMEIYVDGDQFKAVISFDITEAEQKENETIAED